MRYYLYYLILGMMLSWTAVHSYAQGGKNELRGEIEALVKEIARYNILETKIGADETRTEQWGRFEQLQKMATNEELALLTDSKNAVVRCYAFYALALRHDKKVVPILLRHLDDTVGYDLYFSPAVTKDRVSEFYVAVVTPDRVDSATYKLTETERTTVDSLLLHSKTIGYRTKAALLSDIKPKPQYYGRIKEIARQQVLAEAVVALARYKKKEDIPIIMNLFKEDSRYYAVEGTEYHAVRCALVFPAQEFYPYLVQQFEKEWGSSLYDYNKWHLLYSALARYPNETTYQFFGRTVTTEDEFRYQTLCTYLQVAIMRYPNKLYDPLILKIKLDEQHKSEVNYYLQGDE